MPEVQSNMSGTIAEILVKENDIVAIDQDVVVLESMKMHIPIKATAAGKVTKVLVQKGEFVKNEQVLLEIQ